MDKEALKVLISSKPVVYKENPLYSYDEVNDTIRGVNIVQEFALFDVIKEYFKQVYDAFMSEAQVLVVTKDDSQKLPHIPRLPTDLNLDILVLPQVNSWGNTSVSEVQWQNDIVGQDIVPLMRVHSHHTLNAYQSSTDYNSLNSGSLEVVLGDIYSDNYQIAYWLDERGKDTKQNVWKTFRLADTSEKIPSGCNFRLQNSTNYDIIKEETSSN